VLKFIVLLLFLSLYIFYFILYILATKNYVQISYYNTTQKCDKIHFFHITFIYNIFNQIKILYSIFTNLDVIKLYNCIIIIIIVVINEIDYIMFTFYKVIFNKLPIYT